MQKPKLLQYWNESDPPGHVREALASFRKLNRAIEQCVFDRSAAEQFLEEHYDDRVVEAFRACRIPAMQSDYFRYCAMHSLGGIYADANLQCLRNLSDLCAGGSVVFGWPDPLPQWMAEACRWPSVVGDFCVISNRMFCFSTPKHPLLSLTIDIATANIEKRVADGYLAVWVTTGPGIFTSLYLLSELESIDAFRRYARDTVLAPSAPVLCEVVADVDEVAQMWEEIEIRPMAAMDRWAVKRRERKDLENHWLTVKGTIYQGA